MAEGIFSKNQAGTMLAAGVVGALAGITAGSGQQGPAVPSAQAAQTAIGTSSSIEVIAPANKPAVWLWGPHREVYGREIHLTLIKRGRDDTVRIYHTLADRDGNRAAFAVVPPQIELKRDAITAQTFRIEGAGDPARTYEGKLLLVANNETKPAEVPVSIVRSEPPKYADILFQIGAGLGLISVMFGGIAALWKFGAERCIRDIAWASNSWATNTTIASGVLSALLSFVSATDARARLSQAEYTFLIAAFGLPALLAPVLFNAIRRNCKDNTTKGVSGGFLLASAATMLGAQLQLVLLIAMLNDLHVSATLAPSLLIVVQAMIMLVMLIFIAYGNYNVFASIRNEAQLPSTVPTPSTIKPTLL